MHRLFVSVRKHWILALLGTVIVLGSFFLIFGDSDTSANWTTATVEEGAVRRITSVSGTLEATQTAELALSIGGTLEAVRVGEGFTVATGDELAVLVHDDLKAEYESAQAAYSIAQSEYTELVNGLRPEERAVAVTKVQIAEENLIRITREYDERVANAYNTLLSTDLVARPVDKESDDIPPTIQGTYTCGEGTYTLSLYSAASRSGYAYKLSGLETGTFTAFTDSPAPMGACGLTIQFGPSNYAAKDWTITIPNTESASYLTNLNAYNLARTERTNAIRAAEQELELAKKNETVDTAAPRSEALARAQARLRQASAQIATAQAQIDQHKLTAPFGGIITRVDAVRGESVTAEPIITMVSDSAYELIALIPEIDITRVQVGQTADVVFDARQEETLVARVSRVSPLAREINGVSYFEATLLLETPVPWLRGGLNADIDIKLDVRENALRIPTRFLIQENGQTSVLIPDGNKTQPFPVAVQFTGNDGFVAVEGLTRGDTVVAPD